jgi:hypothetical protein
VHRIDRSGKAGEFWQAALGWRRTYEGNGDVILEPLAGSPDDGVVRNLLFQPVGEEKATTNRLHLDLRPQPRRRRCRVRKVRALGASISATVPT